MNLRKIENMKDVNTFLDYCIDYLGLGFHPDDNFAYYSDLQGKMCYSESEANKLNGLMSESFTICENNNIDLYGICIDKIQPLIKQLNINQ